MNQDFNGSRKQHSQFPQASSNLPSGCFEETGIPAFLHKCSWANLRPYSFELTGRTLEHVQVHRKKPVPWCGQLQKNSWSLSVRIIPALVAQLASDEGVGTTYQIDDEYKDRVFVVYGTIKKQVE